MSLYSDWKFLVFISSYKLKIAWQEGGLKSVNCHVLHMVSFPAWHRLGDCSAALFASGRKCYRVDIEWGCFSDSFGGANVMRQLQPYFSLVTVVTGLSNPLAHLLDCYLVLDSISWVWLGRDKWPLLRLWYPNERGSKAHVWFCLGVKIRDKKYSVLISDIRGTEISLRALVEMYHDPVVNDV